MTVTARQVLATRLRPENGAGVETIGEYLIKILEAVFADTEFSSKRPFGSSGWQSDLEAALIDAGHVEGAFDEWGYIDSVDSRVVNQLIDSAIHELRTAWKAETPGN